MKKIIYVLLMSTVLLSCVSGCGNKKTESKQEAVENKQVPEGMERPEFKEGELPEGMEMPEFKEGEFPEGMEMPEFKEGELPEGMERPEFKEGEIPEQNSSEEKNDNSL